MTDVNTRSSLVEAQQDFYPIALGDRRNVLAIGDFTFMVPPYNSLLDNDKLLSNLADYLTDSQRSFDLADFPYFFGDGPDEGVNILLGQDSLWDSGVRMRNGLSAVEVSSSIGAVDNASKDTVFLGLYEDALEVSRYLQAGGISIDDAISFPSSLQLEPEGTAITLLHREGGRHVIVILADTPEVLSDAVDALLGGEFRWDLMNDFTGVRN